MEKTVKTAVAALLIMASLLFPASAAETEKTLVPMGTAIGIRMEADGLLVIGVVETEGTSPAWEAGIREGDLLTHVGAMHVTTARQLREALELCDGEVAVRYLRGGREMQATVRPTLGEDGTPELGVWLRSGLSGIGTLTWIDPEDSSFAALGHGISDPDTGVLLPLRSGCVGAGTVEAITRGNPGTPGELRGSLGLESPCGSISINGTAGIFGHLEPGALEPDYESAVPICPEQQIRCGDAEIISDVSGQREHYSAKILRVYRNEDSRDLLLQVTDPRLIQLTGGIVQGMSGSPILQNGKLVGAVTHVLVSDPTKGYGISAETMLEARQEGQKAA